VIVIKKKIVSENGWLVELFSNKDLSTFRCLHSYMVSIDGKSIRAQHYHNSKTEIIFPIYGSIDIILEKPENKKRSICHLTADEDILRGIVIQPGYAHAVVNKEIEKAAIVVFTDSENIEDVVHYGFEGLQ